VESRLEGLTPGAPAIQVSAEHGCVLLTGDVLTRERGRLVRDVAAVPGVDSVVDLMTERPPDEVARARRSALDVPERPAPRQGAVEVVASIALLVAAFRVRGAAGIALGASAVVLAITAIVPAARRLRHPDAEVKHDEQRSKAW
jgi:hypothetical protein